MRTTDGIWFWPEPGAPHCAYCGWCWAQVSSDVPYDPAKPCHVCNRVGDVCVLPGGHPGTRHQRAPESTWTGDLLVIEREDRAQESK